MINQKEDYLSKEEQVIYEIVDEILRSEDRINALNEFLTNDYKGSLSSQLLSLKEDKEKYLIYIKEVQNEMTNKILLNQNEINIKQSEQAKLKSKISQIENHLKHLSLSTKENIFQMSYEKIEEMINSKKTNDDIQLIDQEISIAESQKKTIELSLNDNRNKQNEMMECLKMLQEEKDISKEEIINLISQKESIEEIIKSLHLQSVSNGKKKIDKSCNDEIKLNIKNKKKEMELSYYEILNADLNKVTNDLQELLFENHSTMMNTQEKNNNKVISSTFFKINSNGSNGHIFDLGNILKKEVLEYHNSFNHDDQSTNIFCQKLSQQLITQIKGYKMPFEDELLYLNELTDLSEENRQNSHNQIPFLTVIDEELLKEDTLYLYIKYIFKISYYEEIIKQRLSFTSKDYKTIKKHMNKQLNVIHNTIIKIITKIDEIDIKISETKNKKAFLSKSHKSKDIPVLSSQDKEYIKQNEMLTLLKEESEEIDREIEAIHSQNKDIKNDYDNKVQLKKEEENEIEMKIQKMMQEIKAEQLALNEEIIQLRNQIAQRFTVIKTQLKIYRENNGNNLALYNKLVESINSTIKSTTKNSPFKATDDKTIKYHTIQAESYCYQGTSRSSHKYNSPKSGSLRIINVNSEKDAKESSLFLNKEEYWSKNKQNLTQKNVSKYQSTFLSPHPSSSSTITVSDQTALWLKERDKLNKTIKTLKEKISKTESSIDKQSLIKRLKPLNEFIHCFCRYSSHKEDKYNPLEDSIQSKSFSFMQVLIAIDDTITNILIKKLHEEDIKMISLDLIDNTIVSKMMKHIIQIYRENRKCQGKSSIEKLIQKEDLQSIPLTKAQKIKAALNKNFNFSIQIKQSQRIEFVFSSYEDFKLWLNGLAFIMKNKALINKYKTLIK